MAFNIFVSALIAGGIIWLILVQKTINEEPEEIKEIKETCLMETIEVPQIEPQPQGYYNEYGVWVEYN